ncbi:MAG TPA: hypothetical protein VE964_17820 [Myxococcales bacterium]|nr:hypothetical protein [Myxococcales bacterium]
MSSLERELETYYARRIDEGLGAALGKAAQEVASQGRQRRGPGKQPR